MGRRVPAVREEGECDSPTQSSDTVYTHNIHIHTYIHTYTYKYIHTQTYTTLLQSVNE